MYASGLAQFSGRKYLNLETLRRTGVAIATPVWFAQSGSTLYVYSLAAAGKVKRVRHNASVRIAPCDIRGALQGAWMPASAQIATGDEAALGHRLLDGKYGWMKRLGGLLSRLRRREYAVIAIDLV